MKSFCAACSKGGRKYQLDQGWKLSQFWSSSASSHIFIPNRGSPPCVFRTPYESRVYTQLAHMRLGRQADIFLASWCLLARKSSAFHIRIPTVSLVTLAMLLSDPYKLLGAGCWIASQHTNVEKKSSDMIQPYQRSMPSRPACHPSGSRLLSFYQESTTGADPTAATSNQSHTQHSLRRGFGRALCSNPT